MKRLFFLFATLLVLAVACNKEVEPSSISLNLHELTLDVGGTARLEAAIAPANATNTAVTWSSNASSVASVDQNGIVTAKSEGRAIVTVVTLAGGKSDACVVTVSKAVVLVTGVELDKDKLELHIGEGYSLTATVEPSDATNTSVSWSSSAPDVASVDAGGAVKALKSGNATITVKTVDGGFASTCAVTVAGTSVPESVTVSPSTVEVAEDAKVQLTATVSPAGASQEVEWAVQNTDIAKVDANGLVTGVKAGTTKVFARSREYPDIQGVCEVTVIKDSTLKGISLSPTEITMTVGQSYALKVIYTPEYAANKKVSWSSGNADVAFVSAEGNVVALAEGTATVTATSEEGGYTASCTVTVGKTTGTRVYYATYSMSSSFCVNGEPDPLTGAYAMEYNGAEYRTKYISEVCTDGRDLYSLEWYASNNTSKEVFYLCKNRKPLYVVEKKHRDDICTGSAARDGKVAFAFYRDSGLDNYVIVIDPDGTVTRSDIPGDHKNMYSMSSAISPSGDLYISSSFKDSFNDRHLGLFKYSADGEWSYTELAGGDVSDGYVGVSDDGDVYVTSKEGGYGYTGILFKNGERSVYYKDEEYFQFEMCVAGGRVYIAVLEMKEVRTLTVRCDGDVIQKYEVGDDQQLKGGMYVTSSGDVYIATTNHIYKNDKVLFTVSSANNSSLRNFCVVE